ncbi:uncharacterized protein LOC106052401 isoform X2 [Biomphalaria glabrata]|uniref:Uncharacterized protein LOC106052401 isoform X2 n=1 Tax=Biomphalaria glabrata TaxID=6526 RepID=A0A9W3ART3_BIOGL|nr:uncharacterized protein LOC106052401 isoform X2 [Biomphalaria glabrata]
MSFRNNILEALSSLNKIVQGVHLLCVDYLCIPDTDGFEVDICSFSSLVGCKSFYILFKSKLMSSEIRPSSCSCSIKSPSKGITVRPLDVRLKATDTLRSYQGRDDIGYDIFKKNYFLWSMDGPKVFHTDYLNITLTSREKWQPWNNLLIRIRDDFMSVMNVTCGPVCGSAENKTAIVPLVSYQSSDHSEYISAIVVLCLVAVGFIISTIVACYKYRKILRERLAQESRSNYDHLDSLMNDASNYQIPQATSTGWTGGSGQSSATQCDEPF